jgi:hypothetical protein
MQMSSVALHQACLEMCKSSTGDARLIFDLGRSPRLGEDGNWVIRWLMWRTRPGYLSRVRHASENQGSAVGCLEAREPIIRKDSCGLAVRDIGRPDSTHESERQRIYWDPARDV